MPGNGSNAASAAEERWRRQRTAALSVRTAIILGPVAGCVAAMAVLSRVLPTPAPHAGTGVRLAWWATVLLGSLVAMWLVDRLTRRLAPLAALLDMAVLFPGRAPTRLRVARRAGDVRQLESLSRQARALDQRTGLADAAEHILALVGALRAHDRHTRGHSERVRVYTDLLAEELRLPSASADRLRWAALLHDIGKLRVPTSTLNKPAKLSAHEWETIREHPAEGARLAAALLPWLGEWGKAIAEHHERFDGTGYPLGLSGRDISLAGRIVAVADSFEVMTAARSYKRAMTRPAALEELVRMSGSQFDPDIVRAFLAVSVPRLRWAMGPTSWLVGTPLLGSAPSITGAAIAAQAAVGISTVAVAGVTGLAGQAAAASTQFPSTGVPSSSSVVSPLPATNSSPHPTKAVIATPTARPASATGSSALTEPVRNGPTAIGKPSPKPPSGPAKRATSPAKPSTPPAKPSSLPPAHTPSPPPTPASEGVSESPSPTPTANSKRGGSGKDGQSGGSNGSGNP